MSYIAQLKTNKLLNFMIFEKIVLIRNRDVQKI